MPKPSRNMGLGEHHKVTMSFYIAAEEGKAVVDADKAMKAIPKFEKGMGWKAVTGPVFDHISVNHHLSDKDVRSKVRRAHRKEVLEVSVWFIMVVGIVLILAFVV